MKIIELGKFLRPFYWKTHPSKNHTIQFKKTGRELDRFTGKLIQSSIGGFWGVTQAVLLETHPDQILHIIYMIYGFS